MNVIMPKDLNLTKPKENANVQHRLTTSMLVGCKIRHAVRVTKFLATVMPVFNKIQSRRVQKDMLIEILMRNFLSLVNHVLMV